MSKAVFAAVSSGRISDVDWAIGLYGKDIVNMYEYEGYEPGDGYDDDPKLIQEGNTPLIVAVLRNDAHMVAHLLKRGADPNRCAADDSGTVPIHVACSNRNMEIIRLLVGKGARLDEYQYDPSTRSAVYPEHIFAEAATAEFVTHSPELEALGFDFLRTDSKGQTAYSYRI